MPNPRVRVWEVLRPYRRALILWLIIGLMIVLGFTVGINKKVIGIVVALFALATQAFSSLLPLIGLVPIVGPLAVKILTLPFFWIINGLGYFLAVFAIKRGYTKDVVNYRVLTLVFMLGLVIGFIIGQIL